MPGIVGIISKRPSGECQARVKSMIACMKHVSSYASGTHFAPDMGIYGGWTALDESFSGGRVLFNESKDISLIFSGESFADVSTRNELLKKGHRLSGVSGDELVHLYEEQGELFFENINGLFSGLLIDRRQMCAFLFNDRYGFDRIYLAEMDDALYFASEAKAILQVLPGARAFSEEGVAQFLALGCTVEGHTLFQHIRLLPGGSVWSFKDESCRKRRYFSHTNWESQPNLSDEAFELQFQSTFKRILPRYFHSHSNIGISLTAGLDTRMLMACRPNLQEMPVCYTFSGAKSDTLDASLAARVAGACGCEHHTLRIGSDFFSNFAAHVDTTVYLTDGCFGAVGAHEVYLNRAARDLAPVRLTGVFGGEILRGTSTFKPLRLTPDLLDSKLNQEVNTCARQFANIREHPVTFAAFKEIPWNIFGSLAACRSQVGFRTPYLDNDLVALA
jgi:asparagine synthase (glutamine-hydrolysing)